MEQEQKIKELCADSAMAEAIFSKELLHDREDKIVKVPNDYFESFPSLMLEKIKSKRKPAIIFTIGRIAAAAAVLLIVVSTYLYIQSNNINDTQNRIAINEIPTSELDAYVNNYEWVMEAELQNEINSIGINFENKKLSKDSSN
jgi:predicted PurR-regulated permease PerM